MRYDRSLMTPIDTRRLRSQVRIWTYLFTGLLLISMLAQGFAATKSPGWLLSLVPQTHGCDSPFARCSPSCESAIFWRCRQAGRQNSDNRLNCAMNVAPRRELTTFCLRASSAKFIIHLGIVPSRCCSAFTGAISTSTLRSRLSPSLLP